jgi:hypothetical protein
MNMSARQNQTDIKQETPVEETRALAIHIADVLANCGCKHCDEVYGKAKGRYLNQMAREEL